MEKPKSNSPSCGNQKRSAKKLLGPNTDLTEADAVGLIVHSYNNYLSAMMGFSELAMLDELTDEARARITEVIHSGEQAVEFGKELLSSLSRIQLRASPLTVRQILKHLSEKLSVPIAQFEDESYKTVSVALDLNWFSHCVEKVISFIRDYFRKIEDIQLSSWIESDAESSWLCLEVSQAGLALEPQTAERIDKPFYTSRQLLGQKDVGLAVACGYARQLGGSFEWSMKDNGFIFRLPLIKPE